MTGTEFDIKPRDESMDEVVPFNVEDERQSKGEVGSLASIEIKVEYNGRVGNDCFDLHCVDERFC